VLSIYREEKILDGVASRAALLTDLVERVLAEGRLRGLVRAGRSQGAIAAFDLLDVATTTETIPTVETLDDTGYTAGVGWRVYEEARQRGAYLRPLGNVVYVTPPLNTPLPDLSRLCQIVEDSLRAVAP